MAAMEPPAGGTAGRGLLVVIAGPSGGGKTTLVRRLLEARPDFRRSVSVTTRPPRAGEADGRDYRFETAAAFEHMRRSGELLEWSEHFGNRYGTPREPVERAVAEGAVIVLEIDVNGAARVRQLFPHGLWIFIAAPDEDALARRLRGRGTESEERIRERLARARMERERAEAGDFDQIIVNDDLERSTRELLGVIAAKLRR